MFEQLLHHFPKESNDILIIADNCSIETIEWLYSVMEDRSKVLLTSTGNAVGVLFALNIAIELSTSQDEIVYFVEDDYLHREGSKQVLLEGMEKFDYVTLYDHPDKYMNPSPNRFVKNGGEETSVFLTKKYTLEIDKFNYNDFAAKVKTLINDKEDFENFCKNRKIPDDYGLFVKLTKQKMRKLGSSIPGYSTHGMSSFLTPLHDWSAA